MKKRIGDLEQKRDPEKRLSVAFHTSILAAYPTDPPGTDPAQRYRDAGQTYFNEKGEELYWFYVGDLPLGWWEYVRRRDSLEKAREVGGG